MRRANSRESGANEAGDGTASFPTREFLRGSILRKGSGSGAVVSRWSRGRFFSAVPKPGSLPACTAPPRTGIRIIGQAKVLVDSTFGPAVAAVRNRGEKGRLEFFESPIECVAIGAIEERSLVRATAAPRSG